MTKIANEAYLLWVKFNGYKRGQHAMICFKRLHLGEQLKWMRLASHVLAREKKAANEALQLAADEEYKGVK